MSKIRKRRRRQLASCPQNLQDLSSLYSPSFFRNSIFYASRPRPDSSRVLFSSSRYERPTHAYVHTYRRTYTYVHAFARRFPISFNNVSRKSIIVFRRWLSPLSLFLSRNYGRAALFTFRYSNCPFLYVLQRKSNEQNPYIPPLS